VKSPVEDETFEAYIEEILIFSSVYPITIVSPLAADRFVTGPWMDN
jgi:hypothetical protein